MKVTISKAIIGAAALATFGIGFGDHALAQEMDHGRQPQASPAVAPAQGISTSPGGVRTSPRGFGTSPGGISVVLQGFSTSPGGRR